MPPIDDPNYLNREQHFADAGIYRISDTQALVQTVDFFTPIVDDPYDFGRIAAANALSDVYAMGGKPLTALNIICFPVSCHPLSIMEKILRGGYDKIIEAGAVLVGGHSVEDNEPKYGLSVTGIVEVDKLVTGSGARPGDCLVLTKPIGTGIISTAVKGKMISAGEAAVVTEGMATLSAVPAAEMVKAGATACTDITGFSLLGHLHEMLLSSGVSAELNFQMIPLYPSVKDMAGMGMIPGGAYRNLDYIKANVLWQGSPDEKDDALIILADPQTSGGLLVALPETKLQDYLNALKEKGADGHFIGRIIDGSPGTITIV